MSDAVTAINITPGEHIHWHVFGVTLNGDTITATLIAGGIILLLGFFVTPQGQRATSPPSSNWRSRRSPSEVERQVESSMGITTAPFVVPLARRCSCSS